MPDMTEPYAYIRDHLTNLEAREMDLRKRIDRYSAVADELRDQRIELGVLIQKQIDQDATD